MVLLPMRPSLLHSPSALLLGLAICAIAGPARAAKTGVHVVSGAEALAEGTPEDASVDNDGAVRPAPALQTLARLNGGPVLAVTCAPSSTCYVATASPGKVLAVDAAGKSTTLWESGKPLVTALVLDGKGGLFAASAPKGHVVRVDLKTRKSTVWWTPTAKVVWALAHDGASVVAATADPGALFRIRTPNQAERLAEKTLTDKSYRSLAVMPDGKTLVVGGGRAGVIATLDGSSKVFALHDSTMEEVTSLAVRPDGVVAAAVAANEGKASGDEDLLSFSDAASDEEATDAQDTRESEVLVFFPSGEARRVWRGKKDTAYAVLWDADGGLLVATGPRGRLYRVDLDARRVSVMARATSLRITALAARNKRVVLGLSHTAALAGLGSAPAAKGTFTSAPLDGGRHVRLGRVWARADVPKGCGLTLAVRSGNTVKPDDTWSAWGQAAPWTGGSAGAPAARYAQVRAMLVGSRTCRPALRELHLAYRPLNMAPQIESLEALAPDVRLEAMPDDEPKGRTFTAGKNSFEDYRHKPLESPHPEDPAPRAKQTFEAGWRSFVWKASDEDGDDLRFHVDLVTDDGKMVRTLASAIRQPFVSLEESSLPDGLYRIRLAVDDAVTNPSAEALRTTMLSDAFYLDRTPPEVSGTLTANGGVNLKVTDLAPIIRVACGVDGGRMVPGTAQDGLLDGPDEQVGVVLAPPGRGHHQVACVAEDLQGNVGRLLLPWDVR